MNNVYLMNQQSVNKCQFAINSFDILSKNYVRHFQQYIC